MRGRRISRKFEESSGKNRGSERTEKEDIQFSGGTEEAAAAK